MAGNDQAVKSARELTAELSRLSGNLESATRYSRRSRRIIWVTVASLVLDIALTIVLAVVAVQANHASHAAENARQSSRALCLAGNVSRHQQADIWNYLLTLTGPPKTPQAAHAVALLRARLVTDFAPRNCTQLERPR